MSGPFFFSPSTYSNNHDEPVYVLQAQILLEGTFSLPVDEFSHFFDKWFYVNDGEKQFAKYTPVHAGFLALGQLLFGAMRATLGLVAASIVVLLYLVARELSLPRSAALLGAIILLLSPLFLIVSTTFLPYNTALMLELGFAFLFLRGTRNGSFALLVLAGVVLGVALFARPWDAILFVGAFGLIFVNVHWPDYRRMVRYTAMLFVGLIPMVGLILAYNAIMTGDPLLFPQNRYASLDLMGFGTRSMLPIGMGDPIQYDVPKAVEGLASSFLQLNLALFGGPLLLALAFFHIWTSRLRRWQDGLLALLLTAFTLGYFFWWGIYLVSVLWGGDKYLGPYHLLPVLVPAVLLASQALVRILRRNRAVAIALALAMSIVGTTLFVSKIHRNYQYTQESREIYRPVLDQELDDALIFLPAGTLLHPYAYLANSPTLDGPIVYALDRGNANFALLDRYPDRAPYRFVYRGIYTEAPDDPIDTDLVRIQRVRLPELVQDVRIVNTTGKPYVYAYIWNNGETEAYLLGDSSRRGSEYEIRWSIKPGAIAFDGPAKEHVSAIASLSEESFLAVSVNFSDTGEPARQEIFERRFWFRISEDDQLEIAFPPEQWRNPDWPNSPWFIDDIEQTMADQVRR